MQRRRADSHPSSRAGDRVKKLRGPSTPDGPFLHLVPGNRKAPHACEGRSGGASRTNLEPAGAGNTHVFAAVGEHEGARAYFTVTGLEPHCDAMFVAARVCD